MGVIPSGHERGGKFLAGGKLLDGERSAARCKLPLERLPQNRAIGGQIIYNCDTQHTTPPE